MLIIIYIDMSDFNKKKVAKSTEIVLHCKFRYCFRLGSWNFHRSASSTKVVHKSPIFYTSELIILNDF